MDKKGICPKINYTRVQINNAPDVCPIISNSQLQSLYIHKHVYAFPIVCIVLNGYARMILSGFQTK